MKALHEKVNIIPLIAKADCLTPSEIKKLKDRVSSVTKYVGNISADGCIVLVKLIVPTECFLCVFVRARYEMKLTSLGSRSTSSPNATPMRMRSSNSWTKS